MFFFSIKPYLCYVIPICESWLIMGTNCNYQRNLPTYKLLAQKLGQLVDDCQYHGVSTLNAYEQRSIQAGAHDDWLMVTDYLRVATGLQK